MDQECTMGKSDSQASIPFIETAEERAKVKKRCRDILFICERIKMPIFESSDNELQVLDAQNVFPLPPLHTYMPEDTRFERAKLFFTMYADIRIVYAEHIGQTEQHHQMNILCCDHEIKIDDFKLRAVLRKKELMYPENGTLVRAYIDTGVVEQRQLILTLDKRKLPPESQTQQLGVIRYADLPSHYRLAKELKARELPDYMRKLGSLMPHEMDKLAESLKLDSKWSYWAAIQQPKVATTEEMASRIHQQQIDHVSNEHLKRGVNFYSKRQYDEACEEFKKALDANPKNAKALSSLGSLYRTQKKYKEAIETLEAALVLDEKNENIKQFLIKALQEYAETMDDYDDLEKLRYERRIFELCGKTRKHVLFQKYLGSIFTLNDGFPWLIDFCKEKYLAKKAADSIESDMEVDSDESDSVELIENAPSETITSAANKPKELPNLLQKKSLVDYGDDDDDDDDEGIDDEGRNACKEMPSVEEVSDNSFEQSWKSRDPDARKRSSRRHREHHERSRHRSKRHPSRSSDHHHWHHSHRHRERRSPRRHSSRDRSSSSNRHRHVSEREHSREYSRRDSFDRASTSSLKSFDDFLDRHKERDISATLQSKQTRMEEIIHIYEKEPDRTSKVDLHRTLEMDIQRRERNVYQKSHTLEENREKANSDFSVSRTVEKFQDLDLTKTFEKRSRFDIPPHPRTSSLDRIGRFHDADDAVVVVDHSPVRTIARISPDVPLKSSPKCILPSKSLAVQEAFASDHSDIEEGEVPGQPIPSIVKPVPVVKRPPKMKFKFKKTPKAAPSHPQPHYLDLDKPNRKPVEEDEEEEEEDRWEPVAHVPCTSYPSFTKKPAVSIMNEIVDMIEEVKKKGK